MAEKKRRFSGNIIAPKGLEALALELKALGWNSRSRRNTINPEQMHLHIDGEPLSLMTSFPVGDSHNVSGEVSGLGPAAEKTLGKLAADLEGLGLHYSLELYDEEEINVARQWGDPSIGEDLIKAARDLLEQQGTAGSQRAGSGGDGGKSGCLVVFLVLGALGLMLL